MDMDKVPMTAEGFARLEAEIKYLKSVERPRIIKPVSYTHLTLPTTPYV